jgi:biotin carboxylase
MLTILCVATYLKGEAFVRECHAQGAGVVLLTNDRLVDAWPHEFIREVRTIPRQATDADIQHAVTEIARRVRIDRVVALDDFDVEIGAMVREYLQVEGFGRTVAARFRDKLTMRTEARRLGVPVPDFTNVFNDDEVKQWTARVAPPWILKPRSSAAATGLRKVANRDELWQALDALGSGRGSYLLEQFVTGEVYHVDSIVRHGAVGFGVASKYGRPPMEIAHAGGVFVTRRLPDGSSDARELLAVNKTLLSGFRLRNGVSHTEFIAGPAGVMFLETSARVGGAYIVDVVEAATGVHLWREWARLELAGEQGEYAAPAARLDGAGIALCLARQEQPDLARYIDPEIVVRIDKLHHAGLIVKSHDHDRVATLLDSYTRRFADDFLATMPVPERPLE